MAPAGRDTRRARAAALLQSISNRQPGINVGKELALLNAPTEDEGESGEQAIGKVIKAIDDLVAKLKVQQADEVKHRDFCKEELHQNEVDAERTKYEIEKLNATLAELADKITDLDEQVHTLSIEIANLQVELQRASENRMKETIEFQKVVADQIRAQDALKKAYAVLKEVYNKHEAVLVQQPAEGPPDVVIGDAAKVPLTTMPPAPELNNYEKHGASNHVLTVITKIIGDAKMEEDASVHDEQNAQQAYEALVKDTNDSVRAKQALTLELNAQLAETRELYDTTDAEKLGKLAELEALGQTRIEIHKQCDFLLANFETRQEARSAEMDSLGEVKAILLGMK